jgi:hypothetical protein
MTAPERTYRQRIHAKTRHLRDILNAIDERAARADAATTAPTHNPTSRITGPGYADPTLLTATTRDDVLGMVERDLWTITEQAHQAASRLAHWAPAHNPNTRCTCPTNCCPNGCTRHTTDGRDEHPTCRSKRSRARRRGEPWALQDTA